MRPREGGNTNFGPRAAPFHHSHRDRHRSAIGGIGQKYASRRRVIPAWRSILDAVAGAFGGTAIAHLAGLPTWALLFQIVMATLAVFVVTPAYRRRFARR